MLVLTNSSFLLEQQHRSLAGCSDTHWRAAACWCLCLQSHVGENAVTATDWGTVDFLPRCFICAVLGKTICLQFHNLNHVASKKVSKHRQFWQPYSSSFIGQIFGKIVFVFHFTCHAEAPCIGGDMQHLNTHSMHSYIHTSALALSGFSLHSQFSDPVTTYTACVLSLGSTGITVMNGSNAPRQGQMLCLLK